MSALQFLKTVVKVRTHLIHSGKGLKPQARMWAKLMPLKRWCDAYPNAPEGGALKMIKKYEADIRELLPGLDSKCGPRLHQEFNLLISQ